ALCDPRETRLSINRKGKAVEPLRDAQAGGLYERFTKRPVSKKELFTLFTRHTDEISELFFCEVRPSHVEEVLAPNHFFDVDPDRLTRKADCREICRVAYAELNLFARYAGRRT